MKYKLYIINLVTYIFISSILMDFIIYQIKENISIFGQLKYVLKYNLNFKIEDLKAIFLILFINVIISIIVFYIMHKWGLKENLLKKIIYPIIIFIVAHLMIFALFHFIGIRFGLNWIYFLFYLIPLLIIVILAFPIYWLNCKILQKYNFKKHILGNSIARFFKIKRD